MLQFADRAWSDEQKEFKCNTKEPGCENVCFNEFAPISNVRLWGLQLLGCSIPACLYLVYVLHLVTRTQTDEREKKNFMKKLEKLEGKKENENGNNNEYEHRPTILGGNAGLPNGVMLRHSEKRKIEKYQKRQRKYSNFNRMIMPKDWRQAGIERRSSVERQIWRLYIFQIFFRSCIDIGFMIIQFYAYPYQ